MSCFVPEQFRKLRWHVIKSQHIGGFEIAEWVECEANGPTERGHWLRWGRTGDFPSLCQATYVGPFPDQAMLDAAAPSERENAA